MRTNPFCTFSVHQSFNTKHCLQKFQTGCHQKRFYTLFVKFCFVFCICRIPQKRCAWMVLQSGSRQEIQEWIVSLYNWNSRAEFSTCRQTQSWKWTNGCRQFAWQSFLKDMEIHKLALYNRLAGGDNCTNLYILEDY